MTPIVVINLKRRPERWLAWEKEAKRMQLPSYQRWEGVDGSLLEMTPEIKHLFRNNDFNMRPGVIGCALTHMSIWLHIIEKGITELIIFEDDARFNEPFEVPLLPQGWDLFYYGGAPLKGIYPPGTAINEEIIVPQLPDDLYFTTIGYRISYQGAEKLLNRLLEVGFNRAVDWFMTDTFSVMHVFCYSRFRVYPDEKSGSDVNANFG